MVIRYLKLQAYTNSSPLSIAPPKRLYAITVLTTTVTKRIYKGLNLSCRRILIFKTNVKKNITSALQPTHRGLGCNTAHSTSYLFALYLFYSYVTAIMSLTRTQQFSEDKSTTKHQKANLIQSLKITHLYISRGSYTIILNNIQYLYNIIPFILSSKLYKNIYPIHLREFQSSNELEGVSDKCMIISVPHDLFTYLHITYITYIHDLLATLQPFTFYLYISHNST